MSEKKKKKKTKEEWFEQNVKKLNYLISLGFGLGVAERISDDEWTYIASEYTVDGILNNIENESQYCGCIFTYENQDMILEPKKTQEPLVLHLSSRQLAQSASASAYASSFSVAEGLNQRPL